MRELTYFWVFWFGLVFFSVFTVYSVKAEVQCKNYINNFVDTGDTGRHISTQNDLVEYNNNLAKY